MLTLQAQQELEALRFADPEHLLKAEEVVKAAEPETSPLNPYFEWDNGVASHQYRLQQARALIRTVHVLNPEDLTRIPKPMYVSVHIDRVRPGGGYRLTDDVLIDDVLREEWRQTALRELEAWSWRFRICNDLVSAVVRAVHLPPPSNGHTQQEPRRRQRKRAS